MGSDNSKPEESKVVPSGEDKQADLCANLLDATKDERQDAMALMRKTVESGAGVATDYVTGTRSAKNEIVQSKDRCQIYFQALKDKPPQGKAKEAVALCFQYVMRPLIYVIAFYVKLMKCLYKIYKVLPLNCLQIIFGLGLCFYGGIYFATIACIEAFRQFGGDLLMEQIEYLWEEGARAQTAVFDDFDLDQGKAATKMSYGELITHETAVAMGAVKDPTQVTKAIQYLLTIWLTVIAVVKFQFAKTVTLCLGVAEMLTLPAVRFFGPPVAMALGPKLEQWSFALISGTMQVIAVIVACYVQAIISAFYSGLRGGTMFAQGLINLLAYYGVMDKFGNYVARDDDGKFDPNLSIVDECIGYPLAALGFAWQFTNGFVLPWPESLVLFPLTITEWFFKWQIFSPQ